MSANFDPRERFQGYHIKHFHHTHSKHVSLLLDTFYNTTHTSSQPLKLTMASSSSAKKIRRSRSTRTEYLENKGSFLTAHIIGQVLNRILLFLCSFIFLCVYI
jgi:hypothetical protein